MDRSHVLAKWQSQLDRRLGQLELLGELDLTEEELKEIVRGVQELHKCSNSTTEFARELPRRYPAVFLAFLVFMGVHRIRDRNYWAPVREILPAFSLNHENIWRDEWERLLRRYRLPTFAHLPVGHRFLMPLQLHAGIPRDVLDRFFEGFLWPLVSEPRWVGATARDVLDDLASYMSQDPTLPRPIYRFFEYGGRVAEQFLARCLRLAESGPDSRIVAGHGLPRHVCERFEFFLAAGARAEQRRGRESSGWYRRPALRFDPSGMGVHLLLPAQKVSDAPAGRFTWHLVLEEQRQAVPVEAERQGEAYLTQEATVAITRPVARLALHLQSAHHVCRGWDLVGMRDRVLFFEDQGGRALERRLLPPSGVWCVVPASSALMVRRQEKETWQAADCRVHLEAEAFGWPGYEARLLQLVGCAELEVIEAGALQGLRVSVEEALAHVESGRPAGVEIPSSARLGWALVGMEGVFSRIEFGDRPLKVSYPALLASRTAALLVEVPAESELLGLALKDRHERVLQDLLPLVLPAGLAGQAPRARFVLGAALDALLSTTESQLVFELSYHPRDGASVCKRVLAVTQAWEPEGIVASWSVEGLEVRWREKHRVADRMLWLWDMWRPWLHPEPIAIEAGAQCAMACSWPVDRPPGVYRGMLGIQDWSSQGDPPRPERGAPGSFELVVGDDADRQAHLAGLGDGPLERAEVFMALGYQGDTLFPQLYNLEEKVAPDHLWPLLSTVLGEIEAPGYARKAWVEKLTQVVCRMWAHRTARELVTWSATATARERSQAVGALIRVGWLRLVGANWQPGRFKHTAGGFCEVESNPPDEALRWMLWDLWAPLGSGLEPQGLAGDPAAVHRVQRMLGVAAWESLSRLCEQPISERDRSWTEQAQDPTDLARVLERGLPYLDMVSGSLGEPAHPLDLLRVQHEMLGLLRRGCEDPAWLDAIESWCEAGGAGYRGILERLRGRGGAAAMLASAFLERLPHRSLTRRPGERLAMLPFLGGTLALLCRLQGRGLTETQHIQPTELDEMALQLFEWAPQLLERDLALVDLVLAISSQPVAGGSHAPVA